MLSTTTDSSDHAAITGGSLREYSALALGSLLEQSGCQRGHGELTMGLIWSDGGRTSDAQSIRAGVTLGSFWTHN